MTGDAKHVLTHEEMRRSGISVWVPSWLTKEQTRQLVREEILAAVHLVVGPTYAKQLEDEWSSGG